MCYLVTARLKPGVEKALVQAVEEETLEKGSVAHEEYLRNMREARLLENGTVRWVEICYCKDPLHEERPYWETYFELLEIKEAHNPENCRDLNGTEPWACGECGCTLDLEEKLASTGVPFLDGIRAVLPGKG